MKKKNRQKGLENLIRRVVVRIEQLQSLSNRFSWIRLTVFIFFAAAIALSAFLIGEGMGWIVFVCGLIVFNIIAFFHRKIDRVLKHHRIWYGRYFY